MSTSGFSGKLGNLVHGSRGGDWW